MKKILNQILIIKSDTYIIMYVSLNSKKTHMFEFCGIGTLSY